MLTELKTGIVQVVDTFASLPTASESVGHLYYVQDEKTVYWANASVGWVTLETQQAGILYVWGVSGSMPFPASGNISSPVREVSFSANWSVVCSSDNAYGAGLKSNGSLWTWGSTGYGARWTNNTTSYSSPVREVTSSNIWDTVLMGCATLALSLTTL
jgi:hypothetical protein